MIPLNLFRNNCCMFSSKFLPGFTGRSSLRRRPNDLCVRDHVWPSISFIYVGVLIIIDIAFKILPQKNRGPDVRRNDKQQHAYHNKIISSISSFCFIIVIVWLLGNKIIAELNHKEKLINVEFDKTTKHTHC